MKVDFRKFFTKYPWVQHVILMIAISVVIVFLISLFIKLYARQGREFDMPQFAATDSFPGKTVSEAMDENDIDLEFVVLDSVYRQGMRAGTILSQDPRAGIKVKKGRKVYVTVAASSDADVIMPELNSLTVRQAVSELQNLGLQVGKITYVDDPLGNTVKEQSCKGRSVYAGQKVPHGSVIDLVVGNNGGSTEVPFLIGKTPDQAHRDIIEKYFNVGREHFKGVTDRATARVYRQEPDFTGVNKYPYGTSVELWYMDATDADAEKMISNFRVDSSKIIVEPEFNPELPPIDELDNSPDSEIW